MEFLQTLIGAIGGGGVVGTLVLMLLRHSLARDRAERHALSDKVERLERDKFTRLERKLDAHLDQDKPGEVALELKHLADAVRDLTSLQRELAIKIARIDKELAASVDRLAAQQIWVANINEAVQQHITGGHSRGK